MSRHAAPAPFLRFVSLVVCYALLVPPPTIGTALSGTPPGDAAPSRAATKGEPRRVPQQQPTARRGVELLVRFTKRASEADKWSALGAREPQSRRLLRGASGAELFVFPGEYDLQALAAEVRLHPAVELVEPNYLISADQQERLPNDPRLAEQWALGGTDADGAARGGADIRAAEAWARTTGAASSVVAVIDSGIDFSHVDLQNNSWTNPREQANGKDDDGNGLVDDLGGYDFVRDAGEIADEHGHGTAVAGIIAAEGDNAIGISGVMWRASLMNLRVLDKEGKGDIASAIEAIDYAVAHGASVINLSWGTRGESRLLKDAIRRAGRRGVLVVCSAGNTGADIALSPRYPAAFDLSNVLSVAATDSTDQLASSSSYGAQAVHVGAPGVNILTTRRGGGYGTLSGTSAAAAVASGVAGLVRTMRPALRAGRTREAIVSGVRQTDALAGKVVLGGVVSAAGALGVAESMPSSHDLEPGAEDDEIPADESGEDKDDGDKDDDKDNNHGRVSGTASVPANERRGNPQPGVPGLGLPNLDQARRQGSHRAKAPDPVPSTERGVRHTRGGGHVGGRPQPTPTTAPMTTPEPTPTAAAVTPAQSTTEMFAGRGATLAPTLLARLDEGVTRAAAEFLGDYGGALSDSPFSIFGGAPIGISSVKAAPASSTVSALNLVNGMTAPGALTATPAAGGSQVQLTWTPGSGPVTGYRVERRQSVTGQYAPIGETSATNYTDTTTPSAPNGTAYLYRVRALDAYGNESASSNVRLAVAMTFVDETVQPGVTPVKAEHITQLRQAVNAVRRTAGLAPVGWIEDPSQLRGTIVSAAHVTGLRTNLDAALAVLGMTPAYEDAGLAGGFVIRRAHIADLRRAVNSSGAGDPTGSPSVNEIATARTDAYNCTGASDLFSGNYAWSLPLVSLPGRAGMDLGLSLAYNSLVWTRTSGAVAFDADRGNPAPGFRLGFPVVQARFLNPNTNKYAYLLVTPSGARIELRQVGATNVYEAADSSYLQLIDNGASLLLRTTDGTQLTLVQAGGEFVCTQIKDRNGNYISASYNAGGDLSSVTDTLGRVLVFNYDSNANLQSITQARGGTTYTWATFGFGASQVVTSSFSTLPAIGIQSGASIPVLRQVGLPTGETYTFDYTEHGQVTMIRRWSADPQPQELQRVTHVLQSADNDAPRVTERRDYAIYWNGNADHLWEAADEAVTSYADEGGGVKAVTLPDRTRVEKVRHATSGWGRGLVTATETLVGGVQEKRTETAWTQDDVNLAYEQNPRVTETNVYDKDGNRKRTTIDYSNQQYAAWGLPYHVTEYASDGSTVLRRTFTDYNLHPEYVSRRIIGLVMVRHVSDGQWQTKIGYRYDEGGEHMSQTSAAPTGHDASYNAGFLWRGNVTAVARYDVTDINSDAKASWTRMGYDQAGSTVWTRNPVGHQSTISYADSYFDDVNSRGTFAYPTQATDAGGFSSKVKYDFHTGQVKRTEDPKGAAVRRDYYADGRIERVTNLVNNAYQRFEYWRDFLQVKSFTTIEANQPEAFSISVLDGAGRVRAVTADHPGSTGGYSSTFTKYDVMGRAVETSNPAETTINWVATGDDAAGWLYTKQTYDWRGRPRVTTNTDGTTKEATYGGCGCAGGETVTLTDEVGRRQKVTSDVLGRTVKVEDYNTDGTSVYRTTSNDYNARDQITASVVRAGTSGTGQTTTTEYDGHGRVWKNKSPEATAPTVSEYNADDTLLRGTDARGASATYAYNNRGLVTGISYSAPAGVTVTPNVSFDYDEAGNRNLMTDGAGTVTYSHNMLSQVTSETRQFAGVSRTHTLIYDYNLVGSLKSINDPFGATVNYVRNSAGNATDVNGSGGDSVPVYASGIKHRAWGAAKHLTYGNNLKLEVQFDGRLRTTEYKVSKVADQSLVMGWQYQHNGDGQLGSSRDLRDSNLDRAYRYDNIGRATHGLSGQEARTGVANFSTDPYMQTYNHDVWGNIVNRTWRGRGSSTVNTYNATYDANNRNPAWGYDLAGNVVNREGATYSYDVNGKVVASSANNGLSLSYDGNGGSVKRTAAGVTTLYLRSSVIGNIISETNTNGDKVRGYVYDAEGTVLAKHESGQVRWDHTDPSSTSTQMTDGSGAVASRVELDPMGVNVDSNNGTGTTGGTGGTGGTSSGGGIGFYNPYGGQGSTSGYWGPGSGLGFLFGGMGYMYITTRQETQSSFVRRTVAYLLGGDIPRAQYQTVVNIVQVPQTPMMPPNVRPAPPIRMPSMPPPPRTPEMVKCDDKLAALFGDPKLGARVGSDVDPSGLKNADGTTRRSGQRGLGHGPQARNEQQGTTDRGGIFHLYYGDGTVPRGQRGGPVYVPPGFAYSDGPYGANNMAFSNAEGISVVISHLGSPVRTSNDLNDADSRRVGYIGGPGGVSFGKGVNTGTYGHVHITTFSSRAKNEVDTGKGTRIDPRSVFCKEFGF